MASALQSIPTPIMLGQQLQPTHLYYEFGPDAETQLDPSQETCQSLLHNRHTFCDRLQALTQHGLTKQTAHCLLRPFSASDVTWTARTMGLPSATAVALDDTVIATLGSLHSLCDWSTRMALRAFHPFSEGGLGFSCVAMREGAIAASWPLCLQDVLNATGHADLFELALRARPLAPALRLTQTLHETVLKTTGTLTLPLPQSQLPKQRDFTKLATQRLISAWENHPHTTPIDQAWRLSCGGSHGGAWLQFRPFPPVSCLTASSKWRFA